MIKPLIETMILLIALILIFNVLGCSASTPLNSDTIEGSKIFTTGCYVVEANAKLGLVNSGGGMEVCKLVCSETLPENFHYRYENRGCNAEVGRRDRARADSND